MDRNTIERNKPRAAPGRCPRREGEDDAAFWRFSLALYARPGVADALIALQDRAGLDVNLILFGLWVGARHGHELGRDGFAAAAQAVAELSGIVRDIRALRRQLGNSAGSEIPRLRRALLRLELAAERRVQHRLAAWFTGIPSDMPGERHAAALANLARCLDAERDSPEAAILRRALAALTRRA
jgi:uncharacterized protein (TIGR02444 family)